MWYDMKQDPFGIFHQYVGRLSRFMFYSSLYTADLALYLFVTFSNFQELLERVNHGSYLKSNFITNRHKEF